MLFPEYSTLVSADRNLEEYPLFELKARQRGSKARLFERVVEGEAEVSLRQTWRVIPSGEYGMLGPVDQDVYLAVLQLLYLDAMRRISSRFSFTSWSCLMPRLLQ